jgi:hypothetical protein
VYQKEHLELLNLDKRAATLILKLFVSMFNLLLQRKGKMSADGDNLQHKTIFNQLECVKNQASPHLYDQKVAERLGGSNLVDHLINFHLIKHWLGPTL